MFDALEERLGIRVARGGDGGSGGGGRGLGYDPDGGAMGAALGGALGRLGGPVTGALGSLAGRGIGGFGRSAVEAGAQHAVDQAVHDANQARGEAAFSGSAYSGFGGFGR